MAGRGYFILDFNYGVHSYPLSDREYEPGGSGLGSIRESPGGHSIGNLGGRGRVMLKKELMQLCMLHLLALQDRYGYEMLSLLHGAFPDTQESAIYAVMRELCREKQTESYYGETSGGPARKYYRITETGRKFYAGLLEQWHTLKRALKELGVE